MFTDSVHKCLIFSQKEKNFVEAKYQLHILNFEIIFIQKSKNTIDFNFNIQNNKEMF